MPNYDTTPSGATSTTYVDDNYTSSWAKVRRVLHCSSADTFKGEDEELESLLQRPRPLRRVGSFLFLEVEWPDEKPKRRRRR